jgi:CDP-diacylglycerol--glycerol-3-phosphate 3-phosphatidyltransferase
MGLVINTGAAVLFGFANEHNYVRMFLYAALVIIGAGIFDMVDGRVARQTDQVTVFGAFFDSVIDRYSDVALFFGLLVFYARGNRFFYVVLVAFVMVTSLMVSYTRARAEALIKSCKVGFMERPERIVLVILGALFAKWGVMAPVLWILAVLSTITVIHRIRFTYQMTKHLAPIRPVVPAHFFATKAVFFALLCTFLSCWKGAFPSVFSDLDVFSPEKLRFVFLGDVLR